jgi:O-antigen/teichoic acid export membrane protein
VAGRNPLPAGTLAVGTGLVLSGITSYGFLAISSHALGAQRYTPLSVLWALVFLAAPGLFLPLEQEVGRAISARRVRGLGGRPVVLRAGTAGAAGAVAVVVLAVAAHRPIVDRLFDGETVLLAAFAVAVACYLAYFTVRGVLAGNGRFGAYGRLLAVEGLGRLAVVAGLAAAAVHAAAGYAMAIGLCSLAGIAAGLPRQRGLLQPGPPAPWAEVSASLGYLLAGSLLAQGLVNVGPLVVKALSGPGEHAAAGIFLNGLVIARIPLFLFQAVQAALLPALAAHAAAREWPQFRDGLQRLLLAVCGVAALAVAANAAIGPSVVRHLFGAGFSLSHADMALLAAASGICMLTLGLGQALIALHGQRHNATGWTAGAGAFAVAVLAIRSGGAILRVELALLAAAAAATLCMAALLQRRLGQAQAAAHA